MCILKQEGAEVSFKVPRLDKAYKREFPKTYASTDKGSPYQWRTQEFCSGGGDGSTNSVENRGQRERGSGGGSPLVRGSGGSCNLVREISFHIVTFS